MSYPAGTLNLNDVRDGIWDWVRNVSQGVVPDDQIIWREQSQPLPARPCVTLKIIDGPRPVGRMGNLFFNPIPNQPLSGQTNPFSVGMQQEMTLSVQIFGNTQNLRPMALQLALDLNSSLLRQSILDKLKENGISVQGVGQPRNLTALEETEYEERAGFEVSLGLAQTVKDEPGVIETVNAEILTESGNRTKEIVLP